MKNLNYKVFKLISDSKSKKIIIFGFTAVEIYNPARCYYKRQKIKILGIKFTYKTRTLKEKAEKYNNELNIKNLSLKLPEANKNNILFIASDFACTGGVETRVAQYTKKLFEAGWNVYILSENNQNKNLLHFTNFYLNFGSENVDDCLNKIIDKYNIKITEFHFKGSKILQNIDLIQLKKKVKIGCVIHNLGIKNEKILNYFDYKIMVSKYMYENFYEKYIKNVNVIRNSVDTVIKKDLPVWEYKNQKTALLVSRIAIDKIKSIECFIKYCQKNNIDFKIAGQQHYPHILENKLIKKYNLSPDIFIGQIDTLDYLSANRNDILFTGGVGLVILESLYLGFPSFCCSDYKGRNYSFVTNSNIMFFDNFTIRNQSVISKINKKEHSLNIERISNYCLRDYILQNRSLKKNFESYLNILKPL